MSSFQQYQLNECVKEALKESNGVFKHTWNVVYTDDVLVYKKRNKLKIVKDPDPMNKGMYLALKNNKLVFRFDPIANELFSDYTIIDLEMGRVK